MYAVFTFVLPDRMLPYTFRHLDGIGEVTERELWDSGILCWDDLEGQDSHQLRLFKHLPGRYEALLAESRLKLETGNVAYFTKTLPSKEHYRILLTFPDDTLFLDIETTGLSHYYDNITMVGWDVNGDYCAWIRGQDPTVLTTALESAKALVTFNGSQFDIRFLKQEFPETSLPACHVDLRYLAARVNMKGGQKEIETQLGLQRPGLEDLRGEDAPTLWYWYTWGDTDAMRRLVAYNRADVAGMKFILDDVIRRLLNNNALPVSREKVPRFSEEINDHDLSCLSEAPANISIEPFRGQPGPEITLPELGTPPDLKVVGIDLSGSEERDTGWCLLTGNEVRTEVLHTDQEIVNATHSVEPDVISIDAPLTLPAGRSRVDDSDPTREEHGIMRECERVLVRRGIYTYPALIESMQSVTARGILLASRFRTKGLPVIESYPGAAQDIMGVPRKGDDETLLRMGLEAFGIEGDVSSPDLIHDELDAITSAVVGVFFWSGRFEALGIAEEDYLIVPDLSEEAGWSRELVVGFSGPIAAGKTTAARLLEDREFRYVRYSQVLEDLAQARDQKPTRETLQELGAEVNQSTHGQRWLNRKMLSLVPDGKRVVVDGLRHPEDHAFLVEHFGPQFLHVFLTADRELRRQRYSNDHGSPADFDEAVEHVVEENVDRLMGLAHEIIENESTLEQLETRLPTGDAVRPRLALGG